MRIKNLDRGIFFCIPLLLPGPLAAQAPPQTPIKFGGQFRARYEASSLDSYAPASRRRSLDQLLFRTRLWAEAAPIENVIAYLQLQDSRVAGSEASVASNEKNLDLHQGYLDLLRLADMPLSARLGRQELSYGDQRLVSTLEWSNIMRAWDGIRLRAGEERWTADLFAAKVKDVAGPRRDHIFSGLYGSCRAVGGHEFDLYLLARDFGDNTQLSESGTLGNLSDRTAGIRAKGRRGAFDYSAEAAYQFGRKAGNAVRALGAAATAGINPSLQSKPRLGLEYDFASGDSNPSDGTAGTFDPLFPFAHAYQGYADVVGWRNIHDFVATASLEPLTGTRLQADFHTFMLARLRDGWYDASGTLLARDTTGAAGRDLGRELDVHVKTAFRQAIKLWFGYSHFFPGNFVARTVGGRDKGFVYFQATLNF